jgi:hypothetical protein
MEEAIKLSVDSTFMKAYSRRGRKGGISDRGARVGRTERYERGWNGEELESQNLLGILGWTKSGALVLIPSFNSGKYDREVKLSLELHASSINSIAKETRYVIDELNKLEQETKKQLETGISPEDKNFLKELHNIAKTELTKPQPNFRQSKSYVA